MYILKLKPVKWLKCTVLFSDAALSYLGLYHKVRNAGKGNIPLEF